jgi:putative intracellular protease/amidase
MAGSEALKPLRIGVMMEEVQISDVIGADILAALRSENVQLGYDLAPEIVGPILPYAPPMTFYFLSSTLEPAKVTMGLRYVPNMTYDDCPRDLDIVLIGGPWLSHRPAAADKFMKEAWEKTPVWLTTCTGSLWLASTGLLNGLKATTNRGIVQGAGQMHPDVKWVEQKWVVESKPYTGNSSTKGELWTAGAAGCGKSCSRQPLYSLG